jgi:hypothetical protein
MVRGGVGANIEDNTFIGQFGADVTFQAFLATPNPPTTAGTWTYNNDNPRDNTNDVFNPTSFTQDPLARLDLRFVGNTGDGIVATRQDAANVFFDNDEPVFKSRTAGQDGNDPPGNPSTIATLGDDNGPFTSGTRRRNATRLADNSSPFNRPSIAGSVADVTTAGFLYPGVFSGADGSTFRRTSSSTTAGFTTVTGGFGATVSQGAGVGETVFQWGIIP